MVILRYLMSSLFFILQMHQAASSSCESFEAYSDDFRPFLELNRQLHPHGLEFGFVLFSSEKDKAVKALAQEAYDRIKHLPSIKSGIECTGNYHNIQTCIPHISLGQYGLERDEITEIMDIVQQIADVTHPFKARMAKGLALTDNNIFYDFAQTHENTDPGIFSLYQLSGKLIQPESRRGT